MSGINGTHRRHYKAGAPIYVRPCSCPACSRKAYRLAMAEDARREQQSVLSLREKQSVRSLFASGVKRLGDFLMGMKSAAA